ncbi:hypothetical protein HPC38_01130 [Pasteurellaceae bacterium HPA106]|uniref:hypothetical protein n=1 Tax=Spirabiliibacterium pneumoniae TaxID=221400 RepID=UPI001AAE0988|nr:hypothetical protein [Spirabiliibacterium pneumoniae]MBE2895484.1 hypothetical protein [Spirabiliibacterium pneumoniae]
MKKHTDPYDRVQEIDDVIVMLEQAKEMVREKNPALYHRFIDSALANIRRIRCMENYNRVMGGRC